VRRPHQWLAGVQQGDSMANEGGHYARCGGAVSFSWRRGSAASRWEDDGGGPAWRIRAVSGGRHGEVTHGAVALLSREGGGGRLAPAWHPGFGQRGGGGRKRWRRTTLSGRGWSGWPAPFIPGRTALGPRRPGQRIGVR
jgi:hypothetical protein